MIFLLKYFLVSHIFFGLLGIIFFYAVLISGIKQINFQKIKFFRRSALFGFLSFVLSWLTGGYYYVLYYGAAVKPTIIAGKYPWAHSIFMEIKEHIFLFLPFAALVITLMFYLFWDNLNQNPKIKNSVIALSAIVVIIGTIIALMGIIISGAVR